MRISSSSIDTSTTTGILLDLASTSGTATGVQFLQTHAFATGTAQSIVTTAQTSGKALTIVSSSAVLTTAGANTGSLLHVEASGAMTNFNGGASLVNISMSNATGNASNWGTFLNINDAATGNRNALIKMRSAATQGNGTPFVDFSSAMVNLPLTSTAVVRWAFTGASGVGNLHMIDSTSATSSTLSLIQCPTLSTGVGQSIVTDGLTTGSTLSISSTSTVLTSGNLLKIAATGAATGATGALVDVTNTAATSTAPGLSIVNSGTGKVAVFNGLGGVQLSNSTLHAVEVATTAGAAITVDWRAGNFQKTTLATNSTYTFTAPPGPAHLTLVLLQDATGGRTVTWPGTVIWSGGTAPTLTTTGNKRDIVRMYYDGTSYFASVDLNF
jgi:hypothetical protein